MQEKYIQSKGIINAFYPRITIRSGRGLGGSMGTKLVLTNMYTYIHISSTDMNEYM